MDLAMRELVILAGNIPRSDPVIRTLQAALRSRQLSLATSTALPSRQVASCATENGFRIMDTE